jgi:hypothetical protein
MRPSWSPGVARSPGHSKGDSIPAGRPQSTSGGSARSDAGFKAPKRGMLESSAGYARRKEAAREKYIEDQEKKKLDMKQRLSKYEESITPDIAQLEERARMNRERAKLEADRGFLQRAKRLEAKAKKQEELADQRRRKVEAERQSKIKPKTLSKKDELTLQYINTLPPEQQKSALQKFLIGDFDKPLFIWNPDKQELTNAETGEKVTKVPKNGIVRNIKTNEFDLLEEILGDVNETETEEEKGLWETIKGFFGDDDSSNVKTIDGIKYRKVQGGWQKVS